MLFHSIWYIQNTWVTKHVSVLHKENISRLGKYINLNTKYKGEILFFLFCH